MRNWKAAACAALIGLAALAGPAQGACSLGKLFELPVNMAGRQPRVPAKINGKPVMLLIDSGAFFNLLSPGAAASLGLKTTPTGGYMRGIGGTAAIGVASADTLTLQDFPFHHPDFIVGGSELGDVAGTIGQTMLNFADVEYDFGNSVVRLIRPQDCGKTNLAYWDPGNASMLDILRNEGEDHSTRAFILLNGVRVLAAFDTGSYATVVSRAAAARAGVNLNDPGVEDGGTQSGIGRKLSQSWIARFDSVKIGDEEIRRTKLRIGDTGGDVDMLIGIEFFLSHHIYVANSAHRMFFTYTGGPVFDFDNPNAGSHPRASIAAAESAPSLQRQAQLFETRGDHVHALEAYDHAIALAPKDGSLPLERAGVLRAMGREADALADLDKAIALAPDEATPHYERALLRFSMKDKPGSRADLDAAMKLAHPADDRRLDAGTLYGALDARPVAIEQIGLWIANHPDDRRMAEALNARCWERALLGSELDRALGDCNAALRRQRGADILDSRGLVELRLGQIDRAIADYNAALVIAPKLPGTLYARGIAKLRKGLKAEGEADMKAGLALDPSAGDKLKAAGVGA